MDCLFALGSQLDPDDLFAEFAVEVRVGVLSLGLAEHSLDDSFKLAFCYCEPLTILRIIARLVQKFSIANQHGSKLGELFGEIVWCNQIEQQSNLLLLISRLLSIFHCYFGLFLNFDFLFVGLSSLPRVTWLRNYSGSWFLAIRVGGSGSLHFAIVWPLATWPPETFR